MKILSPTSRPSFRKSPTMPLGRKMMITISRMPKNVWCAVPRDGIERISSASRTMMTAPTAGPQNVATPPTITTMIATIDMS